MYAARGASQWPVTVFRRVGDLRFRIAGGNGCMQDSTLLPAAIGQFLDRVSSCDGRLSRNNLLGRYGTGIVPLVLE
jgi:hypothetical protein